MPYLEMMYLRPKHLVREGPEDDVPRQPHTTLATCRATHLKRHPPSALISFARMPHRPNRSLIARSSAAACSSVVWGLYPSVEFGSRAAALVLAVEEDA